MAALMLILTIHISFTQNEYYDPTLFNNTFILLHSQEL